MAWPCAGSEETVNESWPHSEGPGGPRSPSEETPEASFTEASAGQRTCVLPGAAAGHAGALVACGRGHRLPHKRTARSSEPCSVGEHSGHSRPDQTSPTRGRSQKQQWRARDQRGTTHGALQ